ncbi:MAG TPA: GAF domain-containing sensor histidine kinase, partial [Planctomycetota bacterium]|nr:GAF domain-containing sensor histidine kinase [Planctomycetota bacterium]
AQHKDAAQAVRVAELLPELKGDPTAVGGNPGVLATGQSVLAEYGGESSALPEVLSSSAAADESETPNLLAEFETRLYLGVPLLVRGQSLGILLFGMSSQDRSFGPSDLAVAEDLARRAGTAIENARLFDEAQDAIHSRDEFLSIASHELKTPLTSLQLEVQVLLHLARRGAQVPAAAAVASGASFAAPPVVEAASSGQSGPTLGYVMSRLELIERQSKKLGSLINALLDVSRIAAGRFEIKLEELDLSRVVKEVIARFSQQLALSGCTLKFDARGAVIGRWDRMRLEQIVTNLISNACKYGRGKPIEIVVEDLPATARLTVRDHGIGIAPENHQRIFGRFERAASARHFGGLGLGLYIVKQILDATGGNIHVSSTPGDGSTFVVDLPKHI